MRRPTREKTGHISLRPASHPCTRLRPGIARVPRASPAGRASAGSGRVGAPQRRRALCGRTALLRTVKRQGFVRVPRFSREAEPGRARPRVSRGMDAGQLRIAEPTTGVARSRCIEDRTPGQGYDGNEPHFAPTPFASPQRELSERDEAQWHQLPRRPVRNYAKRLAMLGPQRAWRALGSAARLVWAMQALGSVGRDRFPSVSTVIGPTPRFMRLLQSVLPTLRQTRNRNKVAQFIAVCSGDKNVVGISQITLRPS